VLWFCQAKFSKSLHYYIIRVTAGASEPVGGRIKWPRKTSASRRELVRVENLLILNMVSDCSR
jgi:hypothetical protein